MINIDKILEDNLPDSMSRILDTLPDSKANIKDAMLEFGKQLLELAAENTQLIDIKRMNCEDHTPYWGECHSCGSYHNYEVTVGQKLDEQSIINTINQVE